MKDKVQNDLENNNLNSAFQHGFRRYNSCLSQFLLFYEFVLESIEDGQYVDIILKYVLRWYSETGMKNVKTMLVWTD